MSTPRAFISFDFDHNEDEKTLFIGQSKNSKTPFSIQDWSSKSALPEDEWKEIIEEKIIKQVFEDVSIEKNVHGLRHFFVTKLVESYGGDLLEVARYTRHRSIETLQVYNDSVSRKRDLPRFYKVFDCLA